MLRSNWTRRRLPRGITLTAVGTLLALGATAAPASALTGTPIGSLDKVLAVPGGVQVGGWAWDGDTTASVPVTVTAGSTTIQTVANRYRADVGRVYPAAGNYRGYGAIIPTAPGPQKVCVTALNVGAGSNKAFSCVTVTVPETSPVGALEQVAATASGIRVAGWTKDPESADPLTVRVAVNGVVTPVTAGLPRPDVQQVNPSYGPTTGFDSVVPADPGTHEVCVTAVNVGAGNDLAFPCRSVTVIDRSPNGALDVPVDAADGLRVTGWATDADATTPVSVRLAVTGSTLTRTVATDAVRPDGTPGFDTVLPLVPGTYEVCATAVNVGPGMDKPLGCSSGTVVDHNPVGGLEKATDSASGGLDVSGWASDVDATAGVSVRLAVTGSTVTKTVTADTVRTATTVPTGFTTVLPLAAGTYEVCGTAVNVGAGADKPLGCITGTVREHSPVGSFDAAQVVATGVRVQGWAADPDTTSPLTVRITVGSITKDLTANTSRSDVPYTYPWASASAGFDSVLTLAAGTHQICASAINVGAGTNKSLGCRSATVPAAPVTTVPGPTNTGVPAGTPLTVINGDYTVTTPGQVVNGLDIRGYLRIKAANVTVKNTIVRGRAGLTGSMALIQSSSPGVQIIDTELNPDYPSYYLDGFVGNNATFTRVNIHHVVDQIKLTGDNVLVQDSWLHDNSYYATVPSGGDTHTDNIQIQAGNNITIRNTVMTGTRNAAMMITQDRGPVSNVTWLNNKADGGACTINVAEKAYGPIRGLNISNNTFGLNMRLYRCAILMPDTTKAISTVTGNVFTDGAVVTVKRG